MDAKEGKKEKSGQLSSGDAPKQHEIDRLTLQCAQLSQKVLQYNEIYKKQE